MTRYILTTIVLIASLATVGIADVKLANVFSDNMVLQQGKKITIWGTAEGGEKVSVTLGAAKADTTADDKGKWQVVFEPLTASDKPIEMTVVGKNTLKLSNILVGEVWLCSGQSNMSIPMNHLLGTEKERAFNAKEIAAADFPNIRLLAPNQTWTELPQDDLPAGCRWYPCSPKTVADSYATAYFFGREIHKALNAPVGLIQSGYGGSSVEFWIPMDVYKTNPDLAYFLPTIKKYAADVDAANAKFATDMADWQALSKAILTTRPSVSEGKDFPYRPQRHLGTGERYGGLYNEMIAPLTRLSIAGVIWYQGEADTPNPGGYQKEHPAMSAAWRKAFNQDFPFLFVQLAGYLDRVNDPNAGTGWAEFREVQAMALSVPKTGMAVAADIGDAKDIHPANKQAVGHRLAVVALNTVYGKKDVVYEGPTFDSMKVDGDKIIVTFKHAEGGLVSKGANGEVSEFAIAGADGKYYWADARIDGQSVILTSKNVPKPAMVRYAFQNNPDKANLYNKADLPACPFRAGEKIPDRIAAPLPY